MSHPVQYDNLHRMSADTNNVSHVADAVLVHFRRQFPQLRCPKGIFTELLVWFHTNEHVIKCAYDTAAPLLPCQDSYHLRRTTATRIYDTHKNYIFHYTMCLLLIPKFDPEYCASPQIINILRIIADHT